MERKVNLVGTGTLTISIPSDWAKYHCLKKGDDLEVIDEGNRLEIYANKTLLVKKTIKVKVGGPKRSVIRPIINLYRRGVNEIKVEYDDLKVIDYIEDVLYYLTGFTIIEQDTHHCILKNIANIDETEFDSSLRRMFLVTLSLAKDGFNAIKNRKYNDLSSIGKLETTQNKLYMFCSRIINIAGHRKFKKPSIMYLFLQRLEDVADYYKYILNYVGQMNNKNMKISKPVLVLYQDTINMLEMLYDMFYKFDIKKDEKLLKRKNEVIKKGHELLEQVSKKEIRIVHLLIEIGALIYACSSTIHGLHIN